MTQYDLNGHPAAVPSLILLHPEDNVLVCVTQIQAGDIINIDGGRFISQSRVDVGHKIARYALMSGEKVIKYGAPIGSITTAVAQADHVHMHNMRSDYIPSHTRTRQNQDRSES